MNPSATTVHSTSWGDEWGNARPLNTTATTSLQRNSLSTHFLVDPPSAKLPITSDSSQFPINSVPAQFSPNVFTQFPVNFDFDPISIQFPRFHTLTRGMGRSTSELQLHNMNVSTKKRLPCLKGASYPKRDMNAYREHGSSMASVVLEPSGIFIMPL